MDGYRFRFLRFGCVIVGLFECENRFGDILDFDGFGAFGLARDVGVDAVESDSAVIVCRTV